MAWPKDGGEGDRKDKGGGSVVALLFVMKQNWNYLGLFQGKREWTVYLQAFIQAVLLITVFEQRLSFRLM